MHVLGSTAIFASRACILLSYVRVVRVKYARAGSRHHCTVSISDAPTRHAAAVPKIKCKVTVVLRIRSSAHPHPPSCHPLCPFALPHPLKGQAAMAWRRGGGICGLECHISVGYLGQQLSVPRATSTTYDLPNPALRLKLHPLSTTLLHPSTCASSPSKHTSFHPSYSSTFTSTSPT